MAVALRSTASRSGSEQPRDEGDHMICQEPEVFAELLRYAQKHQSAAETTGQHHERQRCEDARGG